MTTGRLLGVLFFCLAAGALRAETPASSERLYVPPPQGWTIGYHVQKGPVELTEVLPPGQTMRDWTEMLTVELIDGQNVKGPDVILKDRLSEIVKACDDVGAGPVSIATENGYEVAVRAIACTRSKQYDKGEVNLYKVIRGRDRAYVVARSWRGPPFAKERMPLGHDVTDGWIAFMGQVLLCDGKDAKHPCPDERALGGR